ncbi:hypothetical protein BK730_14025 [Bacillus wiedmannii]|uniref:Uncharacterized protein n=1 Tax=Bacillus wiedmannii TaxID=1890302 RepID=A0A242Z9I0_9BACI|nr:hypothetical protein BK730_14025 [Bacillus wiedmannii]
MVKAIKNRKRKFHFTPFQRLVGDEALKKGKPVVGTRLVLADLLQKSQKKVSLYPALTAGRG